MDTDSEVALERTHDPRVPRHVAIIMDGNGRWAKQRGLPRTAGHREGVKSVRAVVEESVRRGVETLTLFAFSSENWRRPRTEVNVLMELFMSALRSEAKRLHENQVRLRIIGERGAFPEKLQHRIAEAEALTADNTRLNLQVAANYGGRWDIVQAVRRLASEVQSGRLDPAQIDERRLAEHLSFPDLPEPDLFIRTGGEQRLSNFVLWQSAYSELYFSDVFWPDFGAAAYGQALDDYARRQRRFGLTGEQVEDRRPTLVDACVG
ncbi:isoprenyl transferase [Allochromatium tepidum]|uniref:Ditrans,polycis-undecaprenyl-diphosphate synthase ((2E,6E)-farnesyl-diphosphate specific) n=1 Tax=Allochromatium tepidum TaxID=553982 RepID=A0ABN6GCE3_9GAMM|nr:isoprenyl transferase [Allochromatium tepidum]BCU07583.1 ditrans,polycis-undecaprenyl-diphosphate synthase ((2E,6E)-farnesyl-diphosphate specific) [Allochromatium tepidum]